MNKHLNNGAQCGKVSIIRKFAPFAFTLFLVFGISCSKKWEETCNTSVYIECIGNGGSIVQVSKVQLNFSEYSISGERLQGDGFTIDSKNLPSNSNLLLYPEATALFTEFELRQGTYTNLDFEFTLNQAASVPSIELTADYYFTDEEEEETDTLHVHMTFNRKLIVGESMYEISKNLVAGDSYGIYLSVDLNYLLGGITASMLEDATEDDQDLLIVDENSNHAIYNAVYERILSSFTVRL